MSDLQLLFTAGNGRKVYGNTDVGGANIATPATVDLGLSATEAVSPADLKRKIEEVSHAEIVELPTGGFAATQPDFPPLPPDAAPSKAYMTVLTADDVGTGTVEAPEYPEGIYMTTGAPWAYSGRLTATLAAIIDATIESDDAAYANTGLWGVELADQYRASRNALIAMPADRKPAAYRYHDITANTTLDLTDIPATAGISYYFSLAPGVTLSGAQNGDITNAGANPETIHLRSDGTAGQVIQINGNVQPDTSVDAAAPWSTDVDYTATDNVQFSITVPATEVNGPFVTADGQTLAVGGRYNVQYAADRTAADSVAAFADDAATVAEIALMNLIGEISASEVISTAGLKFGSMVTADTTNLLYTAGVGFRFPVSDYEGDFTYEDTEGYWTLPPGTYIAHTSFSLEGITNIEFIEYNWEKEDGTRLGNNGVGVGASFPIVGNPNAFATFTLTAETRVKVAFPSVVGDMDAKPYRASQWIMQIDRPEAWVRKTDVLEVQEMLAANPLAARDEAVALDGIEVRMSFAARQMQIRAASGTIEIEGHHSLHQGTAVEGEFGAKTLTTTWQNLDITDETFTVSGAQEWFHFRRTDTGAQYLVRSRLGGTFNNNSIIFERLTRQTVVGPDDLLITNAATATDTQFLKYKGDGTAEFADVPVGGVLYNQAVGGGIPTTVTTLADIGFALQAGDEISLQTDIGLAKAMWTGAGTVTSTRFQQGGGSLVNTIRFSQSGTVLQFQGNNSNGTRQWLKVVR